MSTANAKHAENRRKLTRTEKKEIAALIRAAKGDGKAHTAQQTIPYLAMYPDGICKVTEKKYSKSIAYDDINYQLAQADDKTAIFENWCDFLNYFDATVSVQLSFINRGTRSGGAEEVVAIPAQSDAFNSIRTEYADMLKHQLAKGNNGFVKSKYITFSVEADNLNAAKARLARIETDILNNFKVLGAAARPMTGYERLEALHSVFHPEGEPFRFSWDWLTPSGLTTKDFIAPSSFRFGEGRYFRMGRKIGAVSFLEILAPELNDRILDEPTFAEGQSFDSPAARVTAHDTQPPKPHTEASLLSAMERAGSADTDPDAERKGLGTPATRAAEIEKLVKSGFVQRKGKQLIPTKNGNNLVCVLPDTLTSPQLTAEWENALTQIARGAAEPEDFMRGIEEMARELVKAYPFLSENQKDLFKEEKVVIGKCPRCGGNVCEGIKNYYCEKKDCAFVMWKNDRFFEERKTAFTPKIAAALLNGGKAKVKKLYSPKTGKTYDGSIVLADTGGKYVNYRIELARDKELTQQA